MAQISLTFPDGNKRDYRGGRDRRPKWRPRSRPSWPRRRFRPRSNGAHCDLQWPIHGGCARSRIHTMKDEAPALELIRHDLAHIMARAVQEIWPDVKVTIGPVRDYGWFYDFDRAEPFTPEDLGADRSEDEADHQRPRSGEDRSLGPRASRSRIYEAAERAVQGGADRPHPRRRGSADVLARALAGPVPWPASAAHRAGSGRCLQADACRRGLLAGRCQPPDVAAHLRRGLQATATT